MSHEMHFFCAFTHHIIYCVANGLIVTVLLSFRQAVDRAYRIGQHRDVVVYRLLMAAAIEEKMYEKQVCALCIASHYAASRCTASRDSSPVL